MSDAKQRSEEEAQGAEMTDGTNDAAPGDTNSWLFDTADEETKPAAGRAPETPAPSPSDNQQQKTPSEEADWLSDAAAELEPAVTDDAPAQTPAEQQTPTPAQDPDSTPPSGTAAPNQDLTTASEPEKSAPPEQTWQPIGTPRLARDIARELSWPPMQDQQGSPKLMFALLGLVAMLLVVVILVLLVFINQRGTPSVPARVVAELKKGDMDRAEKILAMARPQVSNKQEQAEVRTFQFLVDDLQYIAQLAEERKWAEAAERAERLRKWVDKYRDYLGPIDFDALLAPLNLQPPLEPPPSEDPDVLGHELLAPTPSEPDKQQETTPPTPPRPM